MEFFLKNLVAIRYFCVSLAKVKSLNLLFQNRDKHKHEFCKGRDEEGMGTIFKSNIYDHSQLCTLAMLYKFTLHLFFLQNTL